MSRGLRQNRLPMLARQYEINDISFLLYFSRARNLFLLAFRRREYAHWSLEAHPPVATWYSRNRRRTKCSSSFSKNIWDMIWSVRQKINSIMTMHALCCWQATGCICVDQYTGSCYCETQNQNARKVAGRRHAHSPFTCRFTWTISIRLSIVLYLKLGIVCFPQNREHTGEFFFSDRYRFTCEQFQK